MPLRKAGTTFKGLCPFHGEKTPSFVVTPQRESWHCFGCGLGGDIFSFVMQRDGVPFPEALRTLAARAGVEFDERGNIRFNSAYTSSVNGVFVAGFGQKVFSLARQCFEKLYRIFIRAMFRPHNRKYAEFREIRLAAQNLADQLVFVRRKSVFGNKFGGYNRFRHESVPFERTEYIGNARDCQSK